MPFRTLGLDARILQAVQEAGYTEPTPIQAAAIPAIIAGGDLIGIAQTGTGKTAAFTLPMLTRLAAAIPAGTTSPVRGTRALVLAPTRELAVQIQENVQAYAKHMPLSVATIFGGVGERPQIQALKAGTNLIIACPGRLLDLMSQRYGDFSALEYLVLDEADRMLDMGFLPGIRKIIASLPRKRQTLLFSATLSKEIESLTHEFQRAPKTVQIGKRSNPAETVTQIVYEVPQHLKQDLMLHLLLDPKMDSVLVFTRTKHGADRVAKKLELYGVKCGTLHANRSQNQRLKALRDFKDGAVRVLVATDIAARGIDVDGISHVVNFDFPMHVEDYVHRIGRTGRAQAIGDALSFITPDDHAALHTLERFIGRGLVRRKAEGFDYTTKAPEQPEERVRGEPRRNQGRRPEGQGVRNGQNGRPASQKPEGQRSDAPRGQGQGQARPAGGNAPSRRGRSQRGR